MKRNLIAIFSVLSLLFVIQYVQGRDLQFKGTWGDDRVRTITPAPPVVSLVGNTLQFYFEEDIENLTVTIMSEGGWVYTDCISAESSDIYVIPQTFAPGDYTIVLKHIYGDLEGEFTVE